MKKIKISSASYFTSQENTFLFLAVFSLCSIINKGIAFFINEFELLFQEKLPIIYANIRV